jgi:hypothetical protein
MITPLVSAKKVVAKHAAAEAQPNTMNGSEGLTV